jgi:hypothetical protein
LNGKSRFYASMLIWQVILPVCRSSGADFALLSRYVFWGVAFKSPRGTNETWVLDSAEIGDATGNVLRDDSFHGFPVMAVGQSLLIWFLKPYTHLSAAQDLFHPEGSSTTWFQQPRPQAARISEEPSASLRGRCP